MRTTHHTRLDVTELQALATGQVISMDLGNGVRHDLSLTDEAKAHYRAHLFPALPRVPVVPAAAQAKKRRGRPPRKEMKAP